MRLTPGEVRRLCDLVQRARGIVSDLSRLSLYADAEPLDRRLRDLEGDVALIAHRITTELMQERIVRRFDQRRNPTQPRPPRRAAS